MALLVRCPKCGEKAEHPETIIGQTLQCPGCDLRYLVIKKPARGNYAIIKPVSGTGKVVLPPELRGTPTSASAVASLIAGLLGIPTLGVIGLAGLALGIMGLRKTAGGAMKGRALAIAGIVTSAVGILLGIVALMAGDEIWDAFTKPDLKTRQTFAALDAALSRYQDDWGKFPWIENTVDEVMGAVDNTPEKGLRPAKGTPDDAAALLYAALNSRLKRGPYTLGACLMTLEKEAGGVRYRVYCDGWGRPIRYALPDPGMKKPLLESDGDIPGNPEGRLSNE
ncbi:MAG: DUF4190 domain-containing protein [Planctomycetota bacterium]|nr:DUF4190 domain-containing protein [Planctomycetota bacterium]